MSSSLYDDSELGSDRLEWLALAYDDDAVDTAVATPEGRRLMVSLAGGAAAGVGDDGAGAGAGSAADATEENDEWTAEQEAEAKAVLKAQEDAAARLVSGLAKSLSKQSASWTAVHSNEAKQWDEFYRDHGDKFFKDRHYLDREWADIPRLAALGKSFSLLECGCGVGNALFPLVRRYPTLHVVAVDLAHSAIDIVKAHPLYASGRVTAAACDVSREPLPSAAWDLDLVLMLFMMSALSPPQMLPAMAQVADRMRPGATLLFRDYARYDMAQLRFHPSSLIGPNLYVRGDGTKSYFFTEEDLRQLATDAGLDVVHVRFVRRRVCNRKLGTSMPRIWIQALLRKPNSIVIRCPGP